MPKTVTEIITHSPRFKTRLIGKLPPGEYILIEDKSRTFGEYTLRRYQVFEKEEEPNDQRL